MNINDIFLVSGAIIGSVGGAAVIIVALSTWLGKVWANRILESDRARYASELENLKSDLSKKIHEHNVAVSRIDTQRAEALQKFYSILVSWFEIVLNIRAPNIQLEKNKGNAVMQYQAWATDLQNEAVKFAKLTTKSAILLKLETNIVIAKCGHALSTLSINFNDVANNSKEPDVDKLFEIITKGREALEKEYLGAFEPAKDTLIEEFRSIMDPTIKVKNS